MRAGQWLHVVETMSAVVLALCLAATSPALAQKHGGTLRLQELDSPPSASLLEESTITVATPFSGIYNNLVKFNPTTVHESIDSIVPDLAESWSWDGTNTKLTFKLREGVKWHDGTPFTAKDVQCTWRMLTGKGDGKTEFRRNPRAVWYTKLQDITTNGDYEATFNLSAPQPSLLVLLASVFSPVYPCHVPQAAMRTKPIGTGPFKLAEFRRGDTIRLVRNPDYWKKDLPYLDEVTFKTIENRATRILAFSTGEFDITFPSDITIPLMRDVKNQAPQAICELVPTGTLTSLLINRNAPPFDNPDLRKAAALALDRASMNTILLEGKGLIGGAMLPRPVGEWGMPPDLLAALPGYGGDLAKNLTDARALMQKAGYSEQNPLKVKVQTRNLATYRDPAVLIVDQLKKVYIEGELDVLDTTQWYARLARKDYVIAANGMGVSVDDPDGNIVENYACGSERNYSQYCNADVEKLLAAQSSEMDKEKRKKIVWDIERILAEDVARPTLQFSVAGNCWQPYVKGYVPHDNSQYNYVGFEQVWLDK